jgi:hypothetical protein
MGGCLFCIILGSCAAYHLKEKQKNCTSKIARNYKASGYLLKKVKVDKAKQSLCCYTRLSKLK